MGEFLQWGGEKLPEKGTGLLTIFEPSEPPKPERKRVEGALIRCKIGTVIEPAASELDASLWD